MRKKIFFLILMAAFLTLPIHSLAVNNVSFTFTSEVTEIREEIRRRLGVVFG